MEKTKDTSHWILDLLIKKLEQTEADYELVEKVYFDPLEDANDE